MLAKITWKWCKSPAGRRNCRNLGHKLRENDARIRPSKLPKYWPEITWKRCKSSAVEIAEILARNYVKTMQEFGRRNCRNIGQKLRENDARIRPSKLPKYWPEITWKRCKSSAVKLLKYWPEITWKRCKSPAVEIAEILARNYVKTMQESVVHCTTTKIFTWN